MIRLTAILTLALSLCAAAQPATRPTTAAATTRPAVYREVFLPKAYAYKSPIAEYLATKPGLRAYVVMYDGSLNGIDYYASDGRDPMGSYCNPPVEHAVKKFARKVADARFDGERPLLFIDLEDWAVHPGKTNEADLLKVVLWVREESPELEVTFLNYPAGPHPFSPTIARHIDRHGLLTTILYSGYNWNPQVFDGPHTYYRDVLDAERKFPGRPRYVLRHPNYQVLVAPPHALNDKSVDRTEHERQDLFLHKGGWNYLWWGGNAPMTAETKERIDHSLKVYAGN